MIWFAVGFTAAAVELWRPAGPRLLNHRWKRPAPSWKPRPHNVAWLGLPAGVAATVWVKGPALLFALTMCALAAVVGELVRRGRRRRLAMQRRRQLVESLSFLVSELRAGAVPDAALASVAAETPSLGGAARAAASGASTVVVLREAANLPGHEALTELAAAWDVAERSGAPLADVLGRLVERIRDDLDLDRDVEAELAPARATARIMALLPVAALGLGGSMGGDPISVVTGSWVGAISASVGIGLAGLGLMWIERVADSVPR